MNLIQFRLAQINTEETQISEAAFNEAVNVYRLFTLMVLLILILLLTIIYCFNISGNNCLLLWSYYLIAIPIVSTRYFNIRSNASENFLFINWDLFKGKRRKFELWLKVEKFINLLWVIGVLFNVVVNWT